MPSHSFRGFRSWFGAIEMQNIMAEKRLLWQPEVKKRKKRDQFLL
jgi:hypothetical protein